MKNKILRAGVFVLVLVIVITPIFLYVKKFGIGLWDSHDDWAKMGDYFGGILGTILTTISVVFLALQIREQSKIRREELINRISFECDQDVRLYTEKVKAILSDSIVTAQLIQTIMKHDDFKKSGNFEEAKKLIEEYFYENLELCSAWTQVYSSMKKLFELDMRIYRRSRAYVISAMDMQHISFMDALVSIYVEKERNSSLFLDRNKK